MDTTSQKIYDVLLGIKQDMGKVMAQNDELKSQNEDFRKDLGSLSDRTSSLETFNTNIKAKMGVISVVATFIGGIVTKIAIGFISANH